METLVRIIDGPLKDSVATLSFKPLDGETHLFSGQKPDEPGMTAHHYEFSQFRGGFILIETEPPVAK